PPEHRAVAGQRGEADVPPQAAALLDLLSGHALRGSRAVARWDDRCRAWLVLTSGLRLVPLLGTATGGAVESALHLPQKRLVHPRTMFAVAPFHACFATLGLLAQTPGRRRADHTAVSPLLFHQLFHHRCVSAAVSALPFPHCRLPTSPAGQREGGGEHEEAAMPEPDDLPSTVRRSNDKAQRTWKKTHDAAVQTYGGGERAQRNAYAALTPTPDLSDDHGYPE